MNLTKLVGRFEIVILGVTGVGVVLLIVIGVLSRFLFHFSMAWTEELARFLFVWGTFFGAAAAFRTGEHRGIPLLRSHLFPTARKILDIFTAIAILSFLGVLTWQFWGITERALQSGQVSTSTGIPVWVVNFGVFLGLVFAILCCIMFLASERNNKCDEEVNDEPA
jgi:C4-dicarboxylate transporter DctQ subunit